MTKYIAFLRAVNVGGTTLIKMADLKRMFESFGLENVQTYIQTGNVIFESPEKKSSQLQEQIQLQLEKAAGKKIALFLRTLPELAAMARNCPFEPQAGQTIYVVILAGKPARKHIEVLLSYRSEADDFAVQDRQVYNLRRDRDRSVFSNNWVEKILGLPATTRNFTTIQKLAEKYT